MSRKDREKKRKASIRKYQATKREKVNAVEQAFAQQQAALEEHLASVRAVDAYLALLVSELWLGNIAAPVRHLFAAAVFASMPAGRFSTTALEDYATFSAFLKKVHALLPTFEFLEDYVPEPDWGEVKVPVGDELYRIFYGGLCERIPDFIEAFWLKQSGGAVGVEDLRSSIALQHGIISNIDIRMPEGDIAPGTLTIPPEAFWAQCRFALRASAELAAHLTVSPQLVITQGDAPRPGWQAFGDGVMTGDLLPYVLVDVKGQLLPISPRNLHCTVIAYWSQRDTRGPAEIERDTSAAAATFLRRRMSKGDCFAGPFRVSLRQPRRPLLQVAGLLRSDTTLWPVVVMDRRRLPDLPAIEQRLSELFAEDVGLVAQEVATGQIIHVRARHASAGTIRVIVLLAEGSTAQAPLALVPSPSKKLFLPDFVSLIESTAGAAEITAYFDFVDAHRSWMHSMLTGPVDLLAAFKQSHAMLVDGAFEPGLISLDPHWGSNWRYESLKDFWSSAPNAFPDDCPASWQLASNPGGAVALAFRPSRRMTWSTNIDERTTAHFLLDIDRQELNLDGRLLELFAECVADSLAQRLEHLPPGMFTWKRIVTTCLAAEDRLPSKISFDVPEDHRPLLSEWELTQNTPDTLALSLTVDLIRVAKGLQNATNAAFEAACLAAWLQGLGETLGQPIDAYLITRIASTGSRRPRFTFQLKERTVDVPDDPRPTLPSPTHYKTARRDLAVVFKDLGIEPGRYELAEAKAAIDRARDAYRALVHRKIESFSRVPVLLFGIENFDELLADYDRANARVKLSLAHDVDYDRHERMADAHDGFLKNSKDYRYLIEVALSSPEEGEIVPTSEDMALILAYIDWLLVLYQASDTLHHDVDVGGIELDSLYIPDIFYSDFDETLLKREQAQERLEGALGDATSALSDTEKEALDQAFLADAGFTLTYLLQVLVGLSRWPSLAPSESQLRWSYRADRSVLVDALASVVHDADHAQIGAALEFLTLDERRVRVLSGREGAEVDVPVWEHTKRDHRYTIRPLVKLAQDRVVWGAAAAARAFTIWNGTLSDGYLPADFSWPHVNETSALIKRRIENELEVKAYKIGQRHAPFVAHGIDFKSRFPAEGFGEIGDFDVLAYVAERNLWITMECKYNKPPFTLKDARRLREHIFGKTGHSGQLAKIERRSRVLREHHERIRRLLKWPIAGQQPPIFVDLYVCPRIFYWMRRPPRSVSVEFVRLGMLDEFLSERLRTE